VCLQMNQLPLFAASALQELGPANGCMFLKCAVKQWLSASQLWWRSFVHFCGEASENEGEDIRMSVPVGLNGMFCNDSRVMQSSTPVLRNWLAIQQPTLGLAHL
jgi:hypothetical protein